MSAERTNTARLLGAGLAAALLVFPAEARSATAPGSIDVVGTLHAGFERSEDPDPPGLIIDEELHRGFIFDLKTGADPTLYVYDLIDLKLIQAKELPGATGNSARQIAAADPAGHRIFWTLNPRTFGTAGACGYAPIGILDTKTLGWEERQLPCLDAAGTQGVVINGLTYDRAHKKLYAVAIPASEWDLWRANRQTVRQHTYFLQIDPDTLTIDWWEDVSVDCDWHQQDGGSATLARAGDRLVAFCFQTPGPRGIAFGGRGLALSIPLENGRPKRGLTGPVVDVHFTYEDSEVIRLVDPVSGRLMLISRSRPFGPAVWVFDTARGLFVGNIPTGIDPSLDSIEYGFNEETGRLYVHSSKGFVLLDARHTPLPGGIAYPIDAVPAARPGSATRLAIDPKLGRVFRPDRRVHGWVVTEDTIPEPPPPPVEDPDASTADMPEQPGKTDRTYSATANAYGAHLLNVGGVPSAMHSADLRADCTSVIAPNGRCVVPVLVSPGDREFFVAQTNVGVGKNSGAAAFATGGRASPRDFATDADARAIGHCYAARFEDLYTGSGTHASDMCQLVEPLANQLAASAPGVPTLAEFRGGSSPRTKAEDDFPIPSSLCTDFGNEPTNDQAATGPLPVSTESSVQCTAEKGTAAADATARLLSLGDVNIGHATSSVLSHLEPSGGITTTAESIVDGVSIAGVVQIGRVRTTATATSAGRSGTATATFDRELSHVVTPDYTCEASCDPGAALKAINRAMAGMAEIRVPAPMVRKTPRGSTAVVAKDPAFVASDAVMNNNDVVTVDGLELVLINDYRRGTGFDGQQASGRSRFIIGLAGVQVESHYGVFPRPPSEVTEPRTPGGGGDPGGRTEDVPPPFLTVNRAHPRPPSVLPSPSRSSGAGRGSVAIVSDAARLIVNNPRQAGLLAGLLVLLLAPAYLALRRRSAASAWQG